MLVVVRPGGGGLEPRLSPCPMEELDAVDVVSSALAVDSLGSLGVAALLFESISVATTLGNGSGQRLGNDFVGYHVPRLRGGICRVQG